MQRHNWLRMVGAVLACIAAVSALVVGTAVLERGWRPTAEAIGERLRGR